MNLAERMDQVMGRWPAREWLEVRRAYWLGREPEGMSRGGRRKFKWLLDNLAKVKSPPRIERKRT